jgi:hypothetical protein
VHRAKGGLALRSSVGVTVEHLVSVASRPAGGAPLWALQGLLCVAGAAGPAYGPHVKRTLQLAEELLVGARRHKALCFRSPAVDLDLPGRASNLPRAVLQA